MFPKFSNLEQLRNGCHKQQKISSRRLPLFSFVGDAAVLAKGWTISFSGGGMRNFPLQTIFFKINAPLRSFSFSQKHLPANICFYFNIFTVPSSLVRKIFKRKLFFEKKKSILL